MGEGEGKEGDKKGGKKDEKKGAEAGGEEGEEKDEELEAWLEELQHAAAGTRGADEEVPPQVSEERATEMRTCRAVRVVVACRCWRVVDQGVVRRQ